MDVLSVADVFIIDNVVVHSFGPWRQNEIKLKQGFCAGCKQLLFHKHLDHVGELRLTKTSLEQPQEVAFELTGRKEKENEPL